MSTLFEIGKKYQTDKVEHGFLPYYESILNDIKNEKLNVMEIGVFYGSSIKMWNEYLPNSIIYAVDWWKGIQGNGTTFENHRLFVEESKYYERVKIIDMNQNDEDDIKKVCENLSNVKFDFIIDDASHVSRDQQITFEHMWSLVKPGGYFIIEDVHTSLYGKEYYGVYEDNSNSTLTMLLNYNKIGTLNGFYINNNKLIENDIEFVDIICIDNNDKRTYDYNNFRSGTVIIKKKSHNI